MSMVLEVLLDGADEFVTGFTAFDAAKPDDRPSDKSDREGHETEFDDHG